MSKYKLVVASSFNDYQRGDQITDSKLIIDFLTINHPLHEHLSKCRKVIMSEVEKQMYIPPEQPQIDSSSEGLQEEKLSDEIKIKSTKDGETKSKGK